MQPPRASWRTWRQGQSSWWTLVESQVYPMQCWGKLSHLAWWSFSWDECSNLLSSLKLSFFQVSMIGHALNEARMKGGAQYLRTSYLRPISLTLLRFHALLFQVIQPFLTLAQQFSLSLRQSVQCHSRNFSSCLPARTFIAVGSPLCSLEDSIGSKLHFSIVQTAGIWYNNSAILKRLTTGCIWLHSENTWGQNSVQRQRRGLSVRCAAMQSAQGSSSLSSASVMAEPSLEEQILGEVCSKPFLQTVMMSLKRSFGQHGKYDS